MDDLEADLDLSREDVSRAMRGYYLSRIPGKTLGMVSEKILARQALKYLQLKTVDVVNSLTTNEKLRTVLCSQWGYYGSLPENSSFAKAISSAERLISRPARPEARQYP